MPPRCRTNFVRKSQKDLTLFESCAMRSATADDPLFSRLHHLARHRYVTQVRKGRAYIFTLTGRGRYALANLMIIKQLMGT